jgi:hypothetical protein
MTPRQCVDEIVAELRRWIGRDAQLQDDVTLVVVDVGARARWRARGSGLEREPLVAERQAVGSQPDVDAIVNRSAI